MVDPREIVDFYHPSTCFQQLKLLNNERPVKDPPRFVGLVDMSAGGTAGGPTQKRRIESPNLAKKGYPAW